MKADIGDYKILDIQWRESLWQGKPIKSISGHLVYNGTLELLLDKVPELKDFTFKRYGKFFYAEKDCFVKIYKYMPGSTDGFAGREVTLKFDDTGEITFKGSLWDPMSYTETIKNGVPEYRAIAVTDEKEVMERGYTFYSAYITKELYLDLMELVENAENPELLE